MKTPAARAHEQENNPGHEVQVFDALVPDGHLEECAACPWPGVPDEES